MIGSSSYLAAEIVVEEVDSTNDLARRSLEKGGVELPLLVLARRQTQGRGQGTNLWWSDEGSLTFTLAIDADDAGLARRHEPLLALGIGLAILETVGPYVPPTVKLGLRWPNDIEAGGKKLGGILTERVDLEDRPVLLIGVGLNLKTRCEDAPREVRSLATALVDFGGSPDIDEVLRGILSRIQPIFPRLANDDPKLARLWAAADLLLGEPIRVKVGERLVSGVGAGIDERGALLVASEHGTQTIYAGRVLRGE